MKNKIALMILVLTIFSCEEKKKQIENFKIDITTKNTSENNFAANVKTNFPENTSFTITVTRDYNRKNNPEQYAAQYYYSYSSLVKNGEINLDFNVDEEKWINEYKVIQNEQGKYNNELTDIDYSTVKDTLEIEVLFTPKAEQSKENAEIIGENGEFLKGDGVEKNEGFNIFSKKIKVYNKFKNKASR